MPSPPASRTIALLLVAIGLGGCGSATVGELPPAAEPGRAPEPLVEPTGRALDVGTAPEGLAFDSVSRRLGVAVGEPSSVLLLDPADGAIAGRVALPDRARHLAAGPAAGELLAPTGAGGEVVVVDARRAAAAGRVVTGGEPHAAMRAGRRAVVADPERDELVIVEDGEVARRVRVGVDPDGLAVLHDGEQVAVVAARQRVVELYETATGRRIARVPAGVGPTHVVAEDRFQRLYVTDTQGDALLVFETRPELELVRRVHLPGRPYAIALDGRRHRMWVTMTATNRLVELPAHGRPHPLRSLPTVRQPDSVAVDEDTGRVFVAGRHDGMVQVVEP